jgi:hypothetical protein
MSYTVIKLITESWYTSGIVSREFETVSGTQINDGLNFLNQLLADTAIEKDVIPYFLKYSFPSVGGQEEYFIPNLEKLETLVFFINDIRYQMTGMDRKEYFGGSRAKVNSLPFNWHLERCVGGAKLYLYFLPSTNYPMEAWGQFRLNQVAINQDLVSSVARVNLGATIVTGLGTLNAGDLVVNGVDLAGAYANAQALVNYINTGIVPNVSALLVLNQLYLGNASGSSITVVTNGAANVANSVSFYNFSTTSGIPLNQTFMPMILDQFYINYLEFKLAKRMCAKYNFIVPVSVQEELTKYQAFISKKSAPMDLRQAKISCFGGSSNLSYSQANLGLGWHTG